MDHNIALVFHYIAGHNRLNCITGVTMDCSFQKNVVHSQAVMTVVLGVSAAVAIYTLSCVGVLLFVSVHLFITFVCPAWLIKLQDYKE